MPGPPSLFVLAKSTLIHYKDYLEDIGYAPVDIIGDVLAGEAQNSPCKIGRVSPLLGSEKLSSGCLHTGTQKPKHKVCLIKCIAACTAEQLARIEEATLEGSGRDLAPLTWPYWLSHLTLTFGPPQQDAVLPQLPEADEEPVPPPQPGLRMGNYR
jgi:hypothetical protein